jgi:hypothetical protein
VPKSYFHYFAPYIIALLVLIPVFIFFPLKKRKFFVFFSFVFLLSVALWFVKVSKDDKFGGLNFLFFLFFIYVPYVFFYFYLFLKQKKSGRGGKKVN